MILDALQHGYASGLRNHITNHENFHLAVNIEINEKAADPDRLAIVNRRLNDSDSADKVGKKEIRMCRSEAVIEPA